MSWYNKGAIFLPQGSGLLSWLHSDNYSAIRKLRFAIGYSHAMAKCNILIACQLQYWGLGKQNLEQQEAICWTHWSRSNARSRSDTATILQIVTTTVIFSRQLVGTASVRRFCSQVTVSQLHERKESCSPYLAKSRKENEKRSHKSNRRKAN